MKKSRLPRPLRSKPEVPSLRRALPVLASAALLAGCSLSTAPGDPSEGTGGVHDVGSNGGIGLPYLATGGTGGFINTTGTGGSPFEETGGTEGLDHVGTAGAPPPPYEGLGGTTNEPEEPTVGVAGAPNTTESETTPLADDESGN